MDVPRYEIHEFSDVVESGAAVRDGTTVEVSVTEAPPGVARRVVDFLTGIAVTGPATMTRISRGVFLMEPVGGVDAQLAAGPLISLPRRRARPPSNVDLSSATGRGVHPSAASVRGSAALPQAGRPFWPEDRRH
jgi:hypothetical protein